jgi:hypothetical protein
MARLFFRCYTSNGAVVQSLTPGLITSGSVERRHVAAAGGNWLSADHWGQPWLTIDVGLDTDPMDWGKFIQWRHPDDGRRNLYSIDVAHTHVSNQWDTDAIRLKLTGLGLIFVPYVHRVIPEAT